MPGKANIFGFFIVIEEVFLIYLSDPSQLANMKLTVIIFFHKGSNARRQRTSLFIMVTNWSPEVT